MYLSDGTRCRGAYYPGPGAGGDRLVGLHVHGFRSSVENTKARFFLDHALQRGYSWSHFDLPCHGRSEGRFSEFRVSTALEALSAVMRRFRGASLVLLGSSMGAWLAMLAARQLAASRDVRVKGAVLIAPAFDFFHHYFQNEPAEAMRQWQRDGIRRLTDHYDNRAYELDYAVLEDGMRHSLLERPAAYDFPIRIFHGDRDDVVPIDLSHRFKALSAGSDITLRVVKGGDHTLNPQLARIAAEVDDLFQCVRASEVKPRSEEKPRSNAKPRSDTKPRPETVR